jgi:hypothetical protein
VNKNIPAIILSGLFILIGCSTGDNSKYLPQKLGELNLAKVIQNKKGDPIGSPCKGSEDRLTILQSLCQNETSLNAVIIPGAHLIYFLWHIMQVTGI